MKKPRVKLTGVNGNAFSILGHCRRALVIHLREEGYSSEKIMEKRKEFMDEAMSKDYDHLLQTAMKWFDVE